MAKIEYLKWWLSMNEDMRGKVLFADKKPEELVDLILQDQIQETKKEKEELKKSLLDFIEKYWPKFQHPIDGEAFASGLEDVKNFILKM